MADCVWCRPAGLSASGGLTIDTMLWGAVPPEVPEDPLEAGVSKGRVDNYGWNGSPGDP